MKKILGLLLLALSLNLSACNDQDRYADYKSPQGRCKAIWKDVHKEGAFDAGWAKMPDYIKQADELYPECGVKKKFILLMP